MIVKAVLKKQENLEFDIPEKWALEFEEIEKGFIGEPIPYSVLKRFARTKGFKLVSTY